MTTALTLAPTTAVAAVPTVTEAAGDLIKWGQTELSRLGGVGGLMKHCGSKALSWAGIAKDIFVSSYDKVPLGLQSAKIAILGFGSLYAAGRSIVDWNIVNETRALRTPTGSVALTGAQAFLNAGGGAFGLYGLATQSGRMLAKSCPLAFVAMPLAAFALRNFCAVATGAHPLISSAQVGADNYLINYDISQNGSGPRLLPFYEELRMKYDRMLGVNPIPVNQPGIAIGGLANG